MNRSEYKQSTRLLNNGDRRYITGFDGLRVLALLGVIFYHLMPYSVPGGYLGVPIFFAVSGYLITDLFVQEWDRTGSIKVGSFYLRRLRRLYPTLIVVLISSTAYMTLFAHNLLAQIRSVIITNLLFVYNWWEVGHGQSYFDRYNGESPFTHLWYLSVLAQYYFIWPIVMILLLKFIKSRQRSAVILLAGAVISALLMAFLFSPANTNRVYYGSDTRITPYLLGSALSLLWPSTRLRKIIDKQTRQIVNAVGFLLLLIMIWMTFALSGTGSIAYHGGIFLFSIISVLMVGIVAHPGFGWDKWLTNPVFKWLGSRSYAIYMYQFPVMIFYEQVFTNIAAHPVLNIIAEILIILAISELSYRFVEIPLAKFNYRDTWGFIKSVVQPSSSLGWKRYLAIPIVLVIGIAGTGAITAPTNPSKNTDALQTKLKKDSKKTNQKNAEVLKKQKKATKESNESSALSKIRNNNKVKLSKQETALKKQYGLTPGEIKVAEKIPLTGIGDSVMADTSQDIQDIFTNAYVDAKVGRQVWDAPDVISSLKSQGNLSKNVLINLGTNSPMTLAQVKDVENAVGKDHNIYWVNVHVPTQAWQGEVNTTLQKAAKKYSNIKIIDWNALASNQPTWFYGDHVHPNQVGSVQYTKLIAHKIIDDQTK
ncbi:acyltransferase family protein [Pediococcus claussenii]|uniref:Acyltransferase family protein n=1 Tax=Pediococcus claussenii (strain ATCC BAA-344 / DSM 14800 / JCM 18046 / KCTC 3811 / LMG 21948 / P06) TaxID=701521 RepID=G8PCZ9_PEDCP|nr:acyltransferase family protein [Pediococcus claussenii]AEV95134.1 acyltransferase family protein [Pediococcus claussenii ATCC BAA-344]ANZ70318.1 acyltransferase [Pediococcus claussenii]ANZ72134.1 acyltransferase [Pediococcus claussenii]KRN18892.1 hypothetical protein IV79_GL000319 [Pediococcus claussenii]